MRSRCAYEGCLTLVSDDSGYCLQHYRTVRQEEEAAIHREAIRQLVDSGQRVVIPLGHIVPQPGAHHITLRRIRKFNDEIAGLRKPEDLGEDLPKANPHYARQLAR